MSSASKKAARKEKRRAAQAQQAITASPHTGVATREQLDEGLADIAAAYIPFISQQGNGAAFHIDRQLDFAVYTSMQAVLNLRFQNPVSRALHQLVMKHATAAELVAPGSFHETLRDILFPQMGNTTTVTEKVGTAPREGHVRDVVSRYLPPAQFGALNEMLWDALELSGFGGRIVVERTPGQQHIELVGGNRFNVAPGVATAATILRDVGVVVIDGHIISVSEIDQLLSGAAEARATLVLFLRGLEPDVAHTIATNNTRGVFNVLPFIVQFDLDGINTMVDLAVVAGCDVVSTSKGQLLSSVKLSDAVAVEQLDVVPGGVVLYNSTTRSATLQHAKRVKEKADETHSEMAKHLESRVRSLGANTTFLRLPDDASFAFNAQLVDHVLRAVKVLLSHGVDATGRSAIAAEVARHHAAKARQNLAAAGSLVFDIT